MIPRVRAAAFFLAFLVSLPAGLGAQAPAAAPVAPPAVSRSSTFFTPLASGTYPADQLLSVEALSPDVTLRYSIRDPDGAEGPWIPYREPLTLGAAAGEEREYRVIVRADIAGSERERRELWVRIDRKPPGPPSMSPGPGTYGAPVSVKLAPFAPGDSVFYVVHGSLAESPLLSDGSAFIVGSPGVREEDVVQAYSVDGAGNRSAVVSATYLVDARPAELDIKSPVQGAFANAQSLVITFRNVAWVRYTLDGSDPVTSGIAYTGITPLPRQGTTTLRVAAQPRAEGSAVLRRDVTWTYTPDSGSGLRLDAESGAWPRGVTAHLLARPPGTVYYALWEKTPGDSDFIASDRIDLPVSAAGPGLVTLRLRALADDGTWGSEYRFVYVIGGATPPRPLISVVDAEPLRSPGTVLVQGAEDALLYVTSDGSVPATRMTPSSGRVLLTPSPGITTARIRALAMDGFGTVSEPADRNVAMDSDPGTPPTLAVTGAGTLHPAVTAASGEARSLVYEISSDGSDPPAPGLGSSRLVLPFQTSIPFGTRRTFRIRAAALDSAGRVLAPGPVLALEINRRPPAQPLLKPAPGSGVLDEATTVSVAATAPVFVTVTADGTTPADPRSDQGAAVTSVALPGREGATVTYQVKLVAVDAAGNASEVYGPYSYTVDLRTPRLPALAGVRDGGRYGGRLVTPTPADSPWLTWYTVTTDGSVPPDPAPGGMLLTATTTFAGDDGAVKSFRVKLLAASRNGKRLGEKREIAFAIDLKPPDVPAIGGATEGARYARPVELTMDPAADGVTVFASTSTTDAEPDDPVTTGNPVTGPLDFDVPLGGRQTWMVRIATRDDAGNRSIYDRRVRFTIDRSFPDDPTVTGAPPTGVDARPITLSFAAARGGIFYELTDDGTMPRLPTTTSSSYSAPLLLAGRPGESVTYRLLPRAIDDLGNASTASHLVTVTVDRTVPTAPPLPSVTWSAENSTTAYLAWDQPLAGQLYYRVTPLGSPAGVFQPYAAPVALAIPAAGTTVTIDAVVQAASGTRGPATSTTRSFAGALSAPTFRGPRDGGTYAQKVEVRVDAAAGTVHYTIATDGSWPPSVTEASPVFPGSLTVDAGDGQTVNVKIAARAFDPSGATRASSETRLGFVVDRTPPDPPMASGADDGGYYQDARTVSLLAPEGTIYYGIAPDDSSFMPAQGEASRYKGPLEFSGVSGGTRTFRIVAFTVDAAGNRSRETRSWSFTIDQATVYVTPDGNDFADGTRSAPVRGLARAAALAASSPRHTILLAAGDYPLDAPLAVPDGVTILGGRDSETWKPAGLGRMSTISAATPWRGGDALLTLSSGTADLDGVEIRGSSLPTLVSVAGGSLTLSSGAVTLSGTGTGIAVSGGALVLTGERLSAPGAVSGRLVSVNGASLTMNGTSLEGPRAADDFAAIELTGGATALLKATTVNPGSGTRTRGIRSSASAIEIDASRVSSGAGSLEAVAVDAAEGSVTVTDSDIQTAAAARTPTGILASGTSLSVRKARISVEGSASASGITVRGGDLLLSRATVRAGSVREYAVLVRVEEARALIANNVLRGGDAGESVGMSLRGGDVDVVNNTLVAGTGTATTIGVLVQGAVAPRMVNNLLARTGTARGVAIAVIGAAQDPLASEGPGTHPLVLLSNAFTGWQQLLRIEALPGSGVAPVSAMSADALNAADRDGFGGRVAGNIVTDVGTVFRAPGDYHLARGWAGLDAGIDVTAADLGGTGRLITVDGEDPSSDVDGNPRPASQPLAVPGPPRGWDVGASEFGN